MRECKHTLEPVGTSCGDPSDTTCTDPDTCDEFGVCQPNHEWGIDCDDDGNDCTRDMCKVGECVHVPLAPGTPCGDPTETECDKPDTCDGLGVCLENHMSWETECQDDGNDCTRDICNDGVCDHVPLAPGTPCDDGFFCTAIDACIVVGVCEGSGSPCQPGETCDEDNDVCIP